MKFTSILLTTLSSSITLTSALSDYYHLENEKVIQTCAYVSNCEDFRHKIFRIFGPSINIMFPQKSQEAFDIYTLIMGGEDLNKVKLGIIPYFKVCDEVANEAGFCEHQSPEEIEKRQTLSELIDTNSFSLPIESFMLKTDEDTHTYEVPQSGIYCAIFHTSEIPKTDPTFLIEVNWIQAFGKLLVSDFGHMFISFYMSLVYFVFAVIYSFITYKMISKDGASAVTVDPYKYRKHTLQYKFLFYITGMAILFAATTLNYLILNIYGYDTTSMMVPVTNLIKLSSGTLLSVWTIYNLMLFAAGAWFSSLKTPSTKILFAKAFAITLALEMLLYDVESSSVYSLIGFESSYFLSKIIYIEYIGILLLCLAWGVLTLLNVNDKRLKNIYIITMGLLTLLFSVIVFGAYFFNSTVRSTAYAYVFELCITIIVCLLWKNVVFENNELQLKY